MTSPRALAPPAMSEPLECTLDIPFPPSANKIWTARGGGHGQLMRSKAYMAWKHEAGLCAIANGTWRHRRRLPGAFSATILLSRDRRGRGDVDNRIKPVLDWAQSAELIRNDSDCEEVTARWVDPSEAPAGARLILREVA